MAGLYETIVKEASATSQALINGGFEYGKEVVQQENETERNFDNGIAQWSEKVIQTAKTNFGPWLIIIVALICITVMVLVVNKNKNKS